jgi:hypothetical protein
MPLLQTRVQRREIQRGGLAQTIGHAGISSR